MPKSFFQKMQILSIILIIIIIASIAFVLWPKSQHISYKQVQHEVAINSNNVTSKLIMPQSIKSWNTSSLKVLNGWLKDLNEKEAQHFINNLHEITEEAQTDPNADINTVVNTYKQMYLSQIAKKQANAMEKTFNLIFAMIGLLTIMIILVLLGLYSIVMNVKTITETVLDIDQIGEAIQHQSAIED